MTGAGRAARRDRSLEVTPLGDGRFAFSARLTDRSSGGEYEPPAPDVTVHDFTASGEVEGPDLRLTRLTVEAVTHPYPQCPFILDTCAELVGSSLRSGWRPAVLERLRGPAGCTHVVTLLLSLTELTTLTFFLQINESVPYGERQRSDGTWTARGLELVPSLSGACHVLRPDGPLAGITRRPEGQAP
jgi:hypothetical protein